MSLDLQKYFERIDYFPANEPPAEKLRKIHYAHATHIPFENLDAFDGKEIKLDFESLYEKIVLNRRGGYCFEMNGLLYFVLREMGFNASACLSRIYRAPTSAFGPWTHRVTVVDIDGEKYVCDVGYGGNGFVEPVLLKEGFEQKQTLYTYRARKGDDLDYIVDCDDGNGFVPMLGFDIKAAQQTDFEVSSYYTSTHPMSFFKGNRMCALATPKGKRTLFNERLTVNEDGQITVKELSTDELRSVLDRMFNLDASGLLPG